MSAAIQPIAGVAGIAPITSIRHIRLPRRVPAIEVGAYSIMEFKLTKETRLYDTRAIVEGFADEMKRRGHKYSAPFRDEKVSPKQWHTPTDQNRDGIDTVDMAFISTHGGTYGFVEKLGDKTLIPPFWFEMVSDSPDGTVISSLVLDQKVESALYPSSEKPVANMRLGDGKLRWLVLEACRSLQVGGQNERDKKDVTKFEKANPGRTWAPCYAGVQMLFGYTGYITHHFPIKKKGEAFGRKAGRGDLLSESWLDENFSSRYHNIPVVTAFGRTVADLDRRLKFESLKEPGPASRKPIKSFWHSSMWRSK
jgi:Family of unknown function (DUF6345)